MCGMNRCEQTFGHADQYGINTHLCNQEFCLNQLVVKASNVVLPSKHRPFAGTDSDEDINHDPDYDPPGISEEELDWREEEELLQTQMQGLHPRAPGETMMFASTDPGNFVSPYEMTGPKYIKTPDASPRSLRE